MSHDFNITNTGMVNPGFQANFTHNALDTSSKIPSYAAGISDSSPYPSRENIIASAAQVQSKIQALSEHPDSFDSESIRDLSMNVMVMANGYSNPNLDAKTKESIGNTLSSLGDISVDSPNGKIPMATIVASGLVYNDTLGAVERNQSSDSPVPNIQLDLQGSSNAIQKMASLGNPFTDQILDQYQQEVDRTTGSTADLTNMQMQSLFGKTNANPNPNPGFVTFHYTVHDGSVKTSAQVHRAERHATETLHDTAPGELVRAGKGRGPWMVYVNPNYSVQHLFTNQQGATCSSLKIDPNAFQLANNQFDDLYKTLGKN